MRAIRMRGEHTLDAAGLIGRPWLRFYSANFAECRRAAQTAPVHADDRILNTTEAFLAAMALIFTVPYLIWRLGRTEYYAPLVVVQIIAGIVLGPGMLGRILPAAHERLFSPSVIQLLNGIAWWAVALFVAIAGIELDLREAWRERRESFVTASLALGAPLLTGAICAVFLLKMSGGFIGEEARPWQFILGVGMACAVTALPILVLFLERLAILRDPLGQRILRYASLDDLLIWGVLAFILTDWNRLGLQAGFLLLFIFAAAAFRRLMIALGPGDRWHVALIWLALVCLGADYAGLHFMVGAFLAGATMDREWFEEQRLTLLRTHVLLILMPVFFLSTGLRTNWRMGGGTVLLAAALLLVAAVAGKLIGVHLASRMQRWRPGEASLIGWLLQTKALIMIIFVNILQDRRIITSETFTALLLMAVASTMLTIPIAAPKLRRLESGSGSPAK